MLGKEIHERQIIKLLFKTVIEPYMWAVHINSNPLVEYQNHQVAKNTKQKQNLQKKDSKNKYYCISAVPRKQHVVQHSSAGFSPNFSSAGKGPFMDGKEKKYTLFSGGGGGGSGAVGQWREGHGPRPHWEIFLFPYLKTYFTQICCRVIFRQQIKTFDSNNFTMSLMSSFQNACP